MIPFTDVPIFDDGGFTLPGVLYMLTTSGLLWLGILYLVYPPATIMVYGVWAVGFGSLALTGVLYVLCQIFQFIAVLWTVHKTLR